jgi:C4-dicarboxylate transporter DctM subunit
MILAKDIFSPPVGLNAFGLAGVAGDGTKVEEVLSGVYPFILYDILVIILLFAFPDLVLFLPNAMLGN